MSEGEIRELLDEVYSDPVLIEYLDRRENRFVVELARREGRLKKTLPPEREGCSRRDEDGDIANMREKNGRHL